MSRRPPSISAACLAAIVGFATPLFAQNRFEVLTRDSMADASGLRITVVRDNQLSSCFALFTVESPAQPPAPEVVEPPSPAEVARQEAAQRVRYAAERRDLQLAALNAEFQRKAGRPYDSIWSNSNYAIDPVLLGNYEQDRRKINLEYENVLLTEIPGSYPYATPYPGMRTGGFQGASTSTLNAMLDPEPSSRMKAINGQFARIDEALRRLAEAPRLAVSPIPCNNAAPAKPAPAKPAPAKPR